MWNHAISFGHRSKFKGGYGEILYFLVKETVPPVVLCWSAPSWSQKPIQNVGLPKGKARGYAPPHPWTRAPRGPEAYMNPSSWEQIFMKSNWLLSWFIKHARCLWAEQIKVDFGICGCPGRCEQDGDYPFSWHLRGRKRNWELRPAREGWGQANDSSAFHIHILTVLQTTSSQIFIFTHLVGALSQGLMKHQQSIPDASRLPPPTPQDFFGGYAGKFVRR